MTDKETQIVRAGKTIPFFDLPEVGGNRVRSWDYRGKLDLVIFFADGMDCSFCQDFLRQLSPAYKAISAEGSEVLAIVAASAAEAAVLKEKLKLPFHMLYDDSRAVYKNYGLLDNSGKPLPMLIITDKFGEIYSATSPDGGHRLPSPDEVLSWLRFIESQCPECGAPEW